MTTQSRLTKLEQTARVTSAGLVDITEREGRYFDTTGGFTWDKFMLVSCGNADELEAAGYHEMTKAQADALEAAGRSASVRFDYSKLVQP
jgi:hypothetical protein